MPWRLLIQWIAASCLLTGQIAPAQEGGNPLELDNVFDQPAIHAQLITVMNRAVQLGRSGHLEQMEQILTEVVEAVPGHPAPVYNLACAKARMGKENEAFALLERAVDLGLANPDAIERDPDWNQLKNRPRFRRILDKSKTAEPFAVRPRKPIALPPHDGRALITQSNTAWDARRALLVSLFDFNDPPSLDLDIVNGADKASRRIREWYSDGVAAGQYGVLYDNRDGGHSQLSREEFPFLTFLEYGPEAVERRLNWGAQTRFLYNAVTLGNASVAATDGVYWGSMGRLAYSDPHSVAVLYAQYRANHLYIYPEHKDYDPGHNGESGGYGDLFPINTPYVILPQGSSSSDKPFLRAVALTLAAFQPKVKKRLAEKGLLMPAIQVLLRSATLDDEDDLRPEAHRAVFGEERLKVNRMVKSAHRMKPEWLPPLALLEVVEEDAARPGVDYFHDTPSEVLCTTPCAIGRVARSMQYERRMVISAERSFDADNRPLIYHWLVLQGDADRIAIRPIKEDRSVVELRIPYHERFPVAGGNGLESNRIDIGAFVDNRTYASPPSFVSIFYLDNEERTYDAAHRIRSVQYRGGNTPGNYVDPRIDTPKDWRDEYHYDQAGTLTGWTRSLDGQQVDFDAEGRLVADRDADGRPLATHPVFYVPSTYPNGKRVLTQIVAVPRPQEDSPAKE